MAQKAPEVTFEKPEVTCLKPEVTLINFEAKMQNCITWSEQSIDVCAIASRCSLT